MLELGATYYDQPDLLRRVRDASQIYPETSLLARLDTGAVDAAVTYRNMATDRGFDTVSLPPKLNLGDPAHRDQYATVTYTLSDGTRVTGDLIEYGATVRHRSDAAIETFEALVRGDILTDHGFGLPARYPAYEGDVPDRLAP
jgi:molybdate/tungstate transport system substrate-binding protein